MTVLDKIKQAAEDNGYGLTEFAPKIAAAKERFFGEDEWYRCPCDPQSDRACISERCKKEIAYTNYDVFSRKSLMDMEDTVQLSRPS